ncbi:replicative DNA helicase [Tateyamaria omphalii]|uniref:DNA helicase n=1 Tax=Tateyamaria omphalii TaxID=299262 RepID=UPI00167702B1|nr:DNA helicase [Tateyamaria omphalii]GGX49561.1 replicative DNA helicase [Tateyamaria omphalii]
MHLSAPIYQLKRQAKLLARQRDMPLHKALDQIATTEGFQSWGHLASSASAGLPADVVLSQLQPGDLVLLGARPGQGKTLLGLELASKAATLNRTGFFFTLDYHMRDVADRFADLGIDQMSVQKTVEVDTSDEVSADYVIGRLECFDTPVMAVIDYLQLLDQRRTNPDLQDQITSLRTYVKATGGICVVISQVNRSFDLSDKPMPDLSDVRLPNPLDLSIFDKVCFLHNGKLQVDQAA